jgi:salicylate hydroxylase
MSTKPQVLVVGAGLSGLVTALSLQKLGMRVQLVEQASQLGEVGAGLTLSLGTMRCLQWAGVASTVLERSEASTSYPFLHYQTGQLLRVGAPAKTAANQSSMTARQIHRADLHALLVEAWRSTGNDVLTGHHLTDVTQDATAVTAQFANGARITAELLIGCDGVRSTVRKLVLPGRGSVRFTGHVAFRCLVPGDLAVPFMGAGRGAVYVGPGATINRYALRGGAIVNCVGLSRHSDWREEGWSTPASNAEFLAQFQGWHPDVIGLIGAAPPAGIIKWALFAHEPAAGWSADRVTLCGDAAHPMLPYLGLGAAMAIEDAVVLAQALAADDDHLRAFAVYEAVRLPRSRSIFEQSVRQGQLLQGIDPNSYATAESPAHDPSLFDYDPLLARHWPQRAAG